MTQHTDSALQPQHAYFLYFLRHHSIQKNEFKLYRGRKDEGRVRSDLLLEPW